MQKCGCVNKVGVGKHAGRWADIRSSDDQKLV